MSSDIQNIRTRDHLVKLHIISAKVKLPQQSKRACWGLTPKPNTLNQAVEEEAAITDEMVSNDSTGRLAYLQACKVPSSSSYQSICDHGFSGPGRVVDVKIDGFVLRT